MNPRMLESESKGLEYKADYFKKLPFTDYLDLTQKRRFVDITHDPQGRICKVYYNLSKKQYEFRKI